MMLPRLPLLLVSSLIFSGLIGPAAARAASETEASFKKEIDPLLADYCYDCHADGATKGDFSMDPAGSLEDYLKDKEHWIRIWENVRAQMMPPAEKDQPSDADRVRLSDWIERQIFELDPDNPDPGRVTIRRLNREEYRNTIYDLFGVRFDADDTLPPDDTGYGFDTIGDVLSISPMLMEKYLVAAREISAEAVRPHQPFIPTTTISADRIKAAPPSKRTAGYLPMNQTSEVSVKQLIRHPGEYRVTVEYETWGSKEATSHSANLEVWVDGKKVGGDNLGWDNRKTIKYTAKATLSEGENVISLHCNEASPPEKGEQSLNIKVLNLHLQGPMDGSYKVYPKEYYRVFYKGGAPTDPKARRDYTKEVLRRIADRAFRRPVDEATLERLLQLTDIAAEQPGAKFEETVAHAVTAILASPRFLFRAEIQVEPNNPGKVVPLDEFALASRLSYFLWSSLPDEELFNLAKKGELRANLDAQVERMLNDWKAQRFVQNFVGQWLMTRDVEGVNVDPRRVLGIKDLGDAFKVFGSRQRRAMKDETEMLFAYLLKENRSVLELFTADYTFLNETLAKFYGIGGVKGDQMQKVSLPKDSHRGGIFTHGSLLVVTSNPTRTSPVKRGLFLLDNLLGTPAPPAPPGVPTLEEAAKGKKKKLTMREMMEIHREKPLCASCHARMDPLGLALENFNAVGMYRDQEDGQKIDPSGQLITGEKFSGINDLNRIFTTSRRVDFYRCIVSKLLTYALGRGTEYYDGPTVDRIVASMEKNGGKMQDLIKAVVQSAPFQKRRGDGDL
ncbi:MAG: DUF1592 domain-containing protein [Verrucomicrobiales bacterium]|nr:DUF1592 domain-containing protein [Verrucomicrobiales bacterium]